MRNNKIHTPDGVKDFLPLEFSFKTNVERKIESVFYKYGFSAVSSPTFEFLEVFDDKGSVAPPQIYKFLDRDGSMLALRSDMTPAIARIAATEYSESDLPLRFSYITNTFRNNEIYQGKSKEITQAGIELIGASSAEADAEVVTIAVKSLIAAGLDNFRIDIGSVGFFKSILDDMGFDEADRYILQKFILDKDFVSAEKMVNNTDKPDEIKLLFREFPLLIGGPEILLKARKFTKNPDALSALDKLENIYNTLSVYGVEKYIVYDLCMIGHLDYYTDIIFMAYARGASTSIIDGGRYDKLLSKFGADYPAIGFALKINVLMSALADKIKYNHELHGEVTLVAYEKNARNTAVNISENMRSSGLCIENSLIGSDLDKNIKYAARKGFGGILFFREDETVDIISIKDSGHKNVKINDLYNNL